MKQTDCVSKEDYAAQEEGDQKKYIASKEERGQEEARPWLNKKSVIKRRLCSKQEPDKKRKFWCKNRVWLKRKKVLLQEKGLKNKVFIAQLAGEWETGAFWSRGSHVGNEKIRAMMGMGLPKLVLEDQCMDSTVKSIVPDGRSAPVSLGMWKHCFRRTFSCNGSELYHASILVDFLDIKNTGCILGVVALSLATIHLCFSHTKWQGLFHVSALCVANEYAVPSQRIEHASKNLQHGLKFFKKRRARPSRPLATFDHFNVQPRSNPSFMVGSDAITGDGWHIVDGHVR